MAKGSSLGEQRCASDDHQQRDMADTSIFEVARQTHEEVEQCIKVTTDLLTSSPWTLKKEHQTSKLLDEIVSRNFTLHNFYRDAAGDAKAELMRLNQDTGTDNLAEFYVHLGKLKDYHKKYPKAKPDVFTIRLDDGAADGDNAEEIIANDSVARLFSGEEMGGRFLDLYSHHEAFLNLKGIKRVSYLQYIDLFDKLQGESSRIPNEAKKTDAYKAYLRGLQSYLLDFMRKTRPLTDVDALEIVSLASFEEQWEQGKVAGWELKGEELASASKAKEANLQTEPEGVWCDACKRSFAKQTVFDAHLKGQKHIKAAERLQGASSSNQSAQQAGSTHAEGSNQELERMKRQARAKAIARDETIITKLGQELLVLRGETRANVERRSALTDKERQAEAEAAAMELSGANETDRKRVDGGGDQNDEDEEDDEKIYNPLKLPLGWDGKPIPFWLYKLHGLGVDYRCEICSDYVYQGRKNFERHFSESRHAFGMRALGLPNTRHFNEITRIEDAVALADKLKKEGKKAAEEQEAEEVEDEHGNTYTKKTYELLKRQGLI